MQRLRLSLRPACCLRQQLKRIPSYAARRLSTTSSSQNTSPAPWFVDPEPEPIYIMRQNPPHLPVGPASLPADVTPEIRLLHAQLAQSPHLDPSALLVCAPIPTPPGPPLPEAMPKGRRKRGRTYVGEGVLEPGGIWSWIVLAQVKEGTEKRGAIESVVRLVRKTLLAANPPLPLPPNSRKRVNDGWAMVDAGDFAVHVLSPDARQRYFTDRGKW